MALGGGARALGMGGAFTAVADDASTLYWNPAGISGFEKRQALFMHAEQFGSLVNYNFASFVSPTKSLVSEDREAAFGFALVHLGIDDIIITNGLQFEENNGIPGFQPDDGDRLLYDASSLPRESNNDFALFTSFAMNTSLGRVGGTLKLLYSDAVAGNSATGIGLDIGYLRRDLGVPNLDVGVKLQDITGTYISWSTGTNEFITPSVKVGLAYTITSQGLNGAILLSADGNFFFENRRTASQFWAGNTSADLRFGTELVFQEKVMVRGGFDSGNPTAGAGFRVGIVGFDYAYLHHDFFESTHRISGQVDF
jgi:long-subunit fatty acid transport protein